MKFEIPLNKMTVAEKWEALETIWADLTSNPSDIPVPDWHLKVLEERKRKFDAGEVSFSDLETVLERVRKKYA